MLQSHRTLLQLTTKKSLAKPLTTVRFNSSSVGNKVQLNNATSSTTATVDKDKIATAPKKSTKEQPVIENKPKIPFMPVINIPETEFAHHSFFSLHRPLLGLSEEDETPFFSQKQLKSEQERDQEKLDIMLAAYMSDCIPFVDPSKLESHQQGEEWKDGFSEAYDNAQKEAHKTEVSIKVSEDYQDYQDLFGDDELFTEGEQQKPIESYNRPLPMFHMPESGDVLDYLTSVESNMKQEHAKLDAEEKLKALRLKKLEILSDARQYQRKPRFYATQNSRNIHQRLRRYQQKWMLK